MKRFLAVYIGSQNGMEKWTALTEDTRKEREKRGMSAWREWGAKNAKSITDFGAPLGKTKRVNAGGLSDTKNLLTGYTIIEAESHEAAARMFLDHPHFAIFPGDSVEIMECLPIPER